MARNWSYLRSAKGSVSFISGRLIGLARHVAGAGDTEVEAEGAAGASWAAAGPMSDGRAGPEKAGEGGSAGACGGPSFP